MTRILATLVSLCDLITCAALAVILLCIVSAL